MDVPAGNNVSEVCVLILGERLGVAFDKVDSLVFERTGPVQVDL